MKKSLCVLFLILLLALLYACNSNQYSHQQTVSQSEESKQDVSTENSTESNAEINTTQDYYAQQPEYNTEPQASYQHIAIQGAVITDQDGSMRFTYKKKCDSCGKVEPGSTTTSASSGTLSSSFRCSGCGNMQEIRISSSKN